MLPDEPVYEEASEERRKEVEEEGGLLMSPSFIKSEDEADLERKVEILERMRARRGESSTCISYPSR